MKDLGKIIICMDKAHTLGVMVGNMKENIIWIKNMVMVYTFGLMGAVMKDIGKMVNSMEKVNI